MLHPLPELDDVEQLTPAEASEEFERRVQFVLEADVLGLLDAATGDRRDRAGDLVGKLYPALCRRLADFPAD